MSCLSKRRIESMTKLAFFGKGTGKTGIDERIHDLWIASQRLAQTRRRPEDKRNERNQFGILPQHREQARATVEVRQEVVKKHERGAWIARIRELLEKRRKQSLKMISRRLALEGPVLAGQPGRDDA